MRSQFFDAVNLSFCVSSNNFKPWWKLSNQQSRITYVVWSRTPWIGLKNLRIWVSYTNYAAGSVTSNFCAYITWSLDMPGLPACRHPLMLLSWHSYLVVLYLVLISYKCSVVEQLLLETWLINWMPKLKTNYHQHMALLKK